VEHQQQEERVEVKVVSTWLRVVGAGQQHLLTVSDQMFDRFDQSNKGPGQSNLQLQGSRVNKSQTPLAAVAASVAVQGPEAAAAVQGAVAAAAAGTSGFGVQSWFTSAVWVSSATAADQGLQPGQCIVLQPSSSSSSSRGSSLLCELVVLLLLDDGVAWGHVAVAPPLLLCLGVGEHQFVRVQQQQQQPQQQQLRQQQQHQDHNHQQQLLLKACPSFRLCQMLLDEPSGTQSPQEQQQQQQQQQQQLGELPEPFASPVQAEYSGVGSRGIKPGGAAALAVEAAAAALSAAASAAGSTLCNSTAATAGAATAGGNGRREIGNTTSSSGNSGSSSSSSSRANRGGSSSNQGSSWGGLIQNAALKAAGVLLGLPEDATADLMGLNPSATATAAATAGAATAVGDGGRVSMVEGNKQQQQQQGLDVAPEAVAEAIAAWLRLQLAAVAAAAALSASAATAGAAAIVSSDSLSATAASALPLPPALVVHFRVPGDTTTAAAAAAVAESTVGWVDHMLLLLPQLPEKLPFTVAIKGAGGVTSVTGSSSSIIWRLPASLISPDLNAESATACKKSQQGKLQLLQVQYVGAVQLPRTAVAPCLTSQQQLPLMLQPHSKYVDRLTCSNSSSSSSSSLKLIGWPAPSRFSRGVADAAVAPGVMLRPEEYPWLQPTLAAAVKRLSPKLDLKRWQVWQGLGLPLAGGVLVSGGTGSGKSAVLHMVGGCLATAATAGRGGGGGAEVLLVSKRSYTRGLLNISLVEIGRAWGGALSDQGPGGGRTRG
jgi:hypothetical protein